MRRLCLVIASAAALALALSGCASLFDRNAPTASKTPSPEFHKHPPVGAANTPPAPIKPRPRPATPVPLSSNTIAENCTQIKISEEALAGMKGHEGEGGVAQVIAKQHEKIAKLQLANGDRACP